jgi:hypothetical protein
MDLLIVRRLGKLIGHFEEKQKSDLLQVVAVADTIVPQDVGEVPDFGDKVGGFRHIVLLKSRRKKLFT